MKTDIFKGIKPLDFVILIIFLAVIGISIRFAATDKSKKSVVIIQSDTEKFVYPLDENLETEINGKIGTSKIVIKDNCAYFEDSCCPNKTCVEKKISKNGQWSACLPNGIILTIEEKNSDMDAVSF